SGALVILGFIGVGAMQGTVLLSRTAAADMVPAPQRARAISYVLFGALFGAALGPLVWGPMFAGKDLELHTLVVSWFAGAGIALGIGALLDRVGRRPALVSGLVIMAVSTVMLAWVVSIPWTMLSLFLLGLGWNVSYVAASTELVAHATPIERGRLIGSTDLVA